jgi:hypothetical protein
MRADMAHGRVERMAKAAGRLAGLSEEQLPGLVLLFQIVWRDGYENGERASAGAKDGGDR